MKIRMIIAWATLMLTASCSTIFDEPEVETNEITLPQNNQLGASISTLASNYVVIIFYEQVTGDVMIDGKSVFVFENQRSVKIMNLQPETSYHIRVRNNKWKYCDFDITTPSVQKGYYGYQEMDLEYDETSLQQICPLPDGNLVEISNVGMRLTDATGKVIWRNQILPINMNVNTEGEVMAIEYNLAYHINGKTGKVEATCKPSDPEVDVYDACVGKDGSTVLVGYRHYSTNDGWYKKYYIGHFDAKGNVISEQLNGDAQKNIALSVSAKPNGGYLVTADLGTTDLAILTLDKDCKITHTSIDTNEYRDDYYDLGFRPACFDREGNAYFVGRECNYYGVEFCTIMALKVNAQGDIEWIRKFKGTTLFTYPGFVNMVGDDIQVVFSQEGNTRSRITPNMAIFDKAGKLKMGVNFDLEISLLHLATVAPQEEYKLYDEYGDIIMYRPDENDKRLFVGVKD